MDDDDDDGAADLFCALRSYSHTHTERTEARKSHTHTHTRERRTVVVCSLFALVVVVGYILVDDDHVSQNTLGTGRAMLRLHCVKNCGGETGSYLSSARIHTYTRIYTHRHTLALLMRGRARAGCSSPRRYLALFPMTMVYFLFVLHSPRRGTRTVFCVCVCLTRRRRRARGRRRRRRRRALSTLLLLCLCCQCCCCWRSRNLRACRRASFSHSQSSAPFCFSLSLAQPRGRDVLYRDTHTHMYIPTLHVHRAEGPLAAVRV